MQLDERKLAILRMVIDDYIMTAAPVGSRTLSKHGELNLSSATIRNEMSDLEEMGYLDSPHTSAGRVPSQKAYRLYVDTLMRRANLTKEELDVIQSHLSNRLSEVNDVIDETANILSELTKYTSMVMAPTIRGSRIRRLLLVHVSDGRALAVIVTDSGLVHDTIIAVPKRLEGYELEKFSRMLTEKLCGYTIDEAAATLSSSKRGEVAEHGETIKAIISGIGAGLNEKSSEYMVIGGTTNILIHPEYSDVNKARSMLAVLETKDNLKRLLANAQTMELSITIGSENEIEQMKDSSIVTAAYRIGNTPVGSFGVIGPTRMNYGRVVAIVSALGNAMSQILTGMLPDDDKEKE